MFDDCQEAFQELDVHATNDALRPVEKKGFFGIGGGAEGLT
jgi:hypothetical protein